MKKLLKKHWSNILFVLAIILILNPTSKEWLLKTMAFSPSLNSEQAQLSNYNWELQGVNTENLSLKDLEGKVIFVNFWATWCPPCRAEMPSIQKLYDVYKDDVAFLFVTQESKAVVSSFFDKQGYNLPVYNSVSAIPAELTTTNSIPATYIINKKGKIVLSKIGAADWDSEKTKKIIDDLLKE